MSDPKTVIVTATKEQLFEIGMCSNATIKWLMNGQPKKIKSIEYNAYGRRMFYLHGENDNEISSWWGWVYEDMCRDIEVIDIEIHERPSIEFMPMTIGLPQLGIIQNIATEEVTRKDFEGETWKESAESAARTSGNNA